MMNSTGSQSKDQSNKVEWRLFAAIPLPDEVKELVAAVQEELEPEGWPMKWVNPELVHITLKFFGDVSQEQVDDLKGGLGSIAGANPAHELNVGQLGAFPSLRRPRVLWIGLDGNVGATQKLASDVDDAAASLGFERESRTFRPHVTIGRIQSDDALLEDFEAIVSDIGLPDLATPVDRFHLMRSQLKPAGPVYTPVEEWRLGQPDSGEPGGGFG